jgi:hypothetical protein
MTLSLVITHNFGKVGKASVIHTQQKPAAAISMVVWYGGTHHRDLLLHSRATPMDSSAHNHNLPTVPYHTKPPDN